MTKNIKVYPLSTYPRTEENINIATHAIGALAAIVAFIFMLIKVAPNPQIASLLSVLLYGVSLVTLYTASTVFHASTAPRLRHRLNIFDHSAIYFLIAGTYTPYALITLHGTTGYVILAVIWTAAITGIILKFFFIGRFRILSTIMYVLMGWVVVFAIKPLYNNLDSDGFMWLIVGGAAYTIGAALYAIKKIPYNHAIFHVFVLIGSASHFMSIYYSVL